MKTSVNKIAHGIALRVELNTRQALEVSVARLRASGADQTVIESYLAACATAAEVLPVDPTEESL